MTSNRQNLSEHSIYFMFFERKQEHGGFTCYYHWTQRTKKLVSDPLMRTFDDRNSTVFSDDLRTVSQYVLYI